MTACTGRRIAIIGAGMAGAACARSLADRGFEVTLFDKGRSVGGRMAQRRIGEMAFDHGAQFIGARDARFVEAIEAWRSRGLVADWPGATAGDGRPVMVGVPAMNAPVKALLQGLPVRTSCRIDRLEPADDVWSLVDELGRRHEVFDAIVIAVPAPQAVALLQASASIEAAALAACLDDVKIAPCWATMVAFAAPIDPAWTGRRLEDEVLAWVARNSSKPGRDGAETWTLHATPEWSQKLLEEPAERVAAEMLQAFARLMGRPALATEHLSAHRWRYALVTRAMGDPCLWDASCGVGLCGDWCLGPRVEAAFLSGSALADMITA